MPSSSQISTQVYSGLARTGPAEEKTSSPSSGSGVGALTAVTSTSTAPTAVVANTTAAV